MLERTHNYIKDLRDSIDASEHDPLPIVRRYSMTGSATVLQPELISVQLLRAILQFQRKNGYLFSAWGMLRLIEHQIILELDRGSLMRAIDLCIRLSQPAANISHVLKSLRKRGLVREIGGDSEREKLVLLTKKGKTLTTTIDDLSNSLMEGLASNLSDQEQAQVYDLWESINNALGAPPTVVRPGDHPLRLQTRRFTRVFGFLSKKPGDSTLTYPELHILDVLSLSDNGVTLGSLAQVLRVPGSTLKKVVSKLHAEGLCSAPTTRQGKTVHITNVGTVAFARTIGERAKVFDTAFPPLLVKKLAEVLPIFKGMVETWNPDYSAPQKDLRITCEYDFFARLRIQHLRTHARNFWGLNPNLDSINEGDSKTILVSRGVTPCFFLKYCASGAEVSLEDFGCAPSVDWDSVAALVSQVFEAQSSNDSAILLHTNHLTAPLRSLLSFATNQKTFVRFADLPASN